MRRRRRFFCAVALLAAASMLAAACGDDDDGGGVDDAAPEPTEELAGEPIVISVISSNRAPEIYDGANAAADAINAAGGVKDPSGGAARPVQILQCDADPVADPNAPTNCAREAIAAGAIAAAGKLSS